MDGRKKAMLPCRVVGWLFWIKGVLEMHNRNPATRRGASTRAPRSFAGRSALEVFESRTLFSSATDTAPLGATHTPGCNCGCTGFRTFEQTQLAVQQARDTVPALAESRYVKLQRARGVESFWKPMNALPAGKSTSVQTVHAAAMAPFRIDLKSLRSRLTKAPLENTPAAAAPLSISLPNPSGGFSRFAVVESPVFEAALGQKFKSIKTYSGQGIDDPSQVLRFDVTPQGLRATVLGGSGTYYIDPTFHRQTSSFVAYFRRDSFINPDNMGYTCDTASPGDGLAPRPEDETRDPTTPAAIGSTGRSGTQLRNYRIGISATGEYTAFQGGTVTLGLSAIVGVVNRLNSVYERDLSIRLTLIANNDQLVFTNAATDPFTSPTNGSTTNAQNQTLLDNPAVVGSANYDIGHVLTRGSNNGLAGSIGNVGIAGQKARGYSSFSAPTTDPFTIDYVAHEIGHQFGARHSFSNCGGSAGDSASLAVEPGGGTTIMAYAGICGPGFDIQANSDAMFHSINFDQIMSYVDGTIPGVGSRAATGNFAPVVSTQGTRSIPANTPYALTATASDGNGDTLTYSWEQRNGASGTALNSTTATSGPIVRAFLPSSSPTRTVPNLASLNANTVVNGERLSTVARTMNFTVMVRDNRAGGGGVNTASLVLNVVNTGAAFAVTSPNTNVSLPAGSNQTITWNVAGTTASGINTANVKISLSTDAGLTYPVVLAEATPNDGSEPLVFPADLPLTSQARIRIEAVGNYFFDVSNSTFSITPPVPAAPTLDPASDTGVSDSDRITRRNNSSAAGTLTFNIADTIPGFTVRLVRAGLTIASSVATSTTTTLTTNGSDVFPDGSNVFTAVHVTPSNVVSPASVATAVFIDNVAPVATYGISPAARNVPVGSVPITFPESVFNLTASSFFLVREGVTQPTADLTLTGSAAAYTFSDLTTLTSPTADYTLNLFSAATDAAGNPASGLIAFSNNVLNLPTAPVGGNQVVLRSNASNPASLQVFLNNTTATPTFNWTFTPGQTFRIDGSTGADVVRFEGTTSSYNAAIRLALAGSTAADDQLNVASGIFNADAELGAGTRVSVFSNARINFTAPQTVRSLDLQSNATASVQANIVLNSTPTLANNAAPLGTRAYTAFFDVTDKSLVVRNGDLAALRDMTRHWLTASAGLPGTTGLGSSLAFYQPTTAFNTVGIISNAGFPGSPSFPSFAGVAVSATDVLLRYTRIGDTDLSGTIDSTDLARLLQGLQGTASTLPGGGTGWNFGDFDYDADTDAFDLGRLIASLRDQV